MVQIIFRELWYKGDRYKRIFLCAVNIARDKNVDYGERFRRQIWKQKREKRCGNIKSTNPTVRRA